MSLAEVSRSMLTPSDLRNWRLISRCLIFICAFLGVVGLIYIKPLAIPFAFSLLIYAILRTSSRALNTHLKIPLGLSVAVVLTIGFLSFFGFGLLITTSVSSFVQGASVYTEKLAVFPRWLEGQLQSSGFDLGVLNLQDLALNLPFAEYARNLTGTLTGIVGNIALISIFVLFLLLGEKKNSVEGPQSIPLLEEIITKVSAYAGAKLLLSLLTGALTGLVLLTMNVNLALLFTVLTVILNFIPNVGSIIAVLLPLPIVLLQYGLGWQSLFVFGSTGFIQFAIGNVLEPRLMGRSLSLHPVVILIALVFWGLIWGIPGMFLAVPITAVLKIVIGLFQTTHGLVAIFEGDLSIMNSRSMQPTSKESH